MGRFPAHRVAPGNKELADVRRPTGRERQKRLGPSLYEIIVHKPVSLVRDTKTRHCFVLGIVSSRHKLQYRLVVRTE